AAGRDINKKQDEFHFNYAIARGDVDIVTRLVAVEHKKMFAGVMIRESLEPNAANAYAFFSGKRVDFRSRTRRGAATTETRGARTTAPVWMKLERRGTTITAYASPDGNIWTFIGHEVIDLPQTFYVGLA